MLLTTCTSCKGLFTKSLHIDGSVWRVSWTALFHSTPASRGRAFRRFPVPNQRGQFEHHKLPERIREAEFDYPVWKDTLHKKWPGFWFGKKFVYVKEMEPELMVPNLDDFKLKPYVSYRTPEIFQPKFTARDLFNATYADEIIDKFKNGQEMVMEASPEDAENARVAAEKTGADLFLQKPPDD